MIAICATRLLGCPTLNRICTDIAKTDLTQSRTSAGEKWPSALWHLMGCVVSFSPDMRVAAGGGEAG